MFIRLQKKRYFFLASLYVVYVLVSYSPIKTENNRTIEKPHQILNFKNDDYNC